MTCKLCTFMFWKFCYLGGGVIVRGVFVLGGNCPGGNCPGVIVRGVIVRGVIVLEPHLTQCSIICLLTSLLKSLEIVSRRLEQMLSSSDTRLKWLGEGLLFKLDSNKRWRAKMQPIFESFPGPLLKSFKIKM